MQICLMCFFGQRTISEYELLSYQLYSSDWPTVIAISKRKDTKMYQKMVIILMGTMKQETKFMIGKVFSLDMETFRKVS